jgi:hypothetical protein
MESGNSEELRDAMNDVATTVEYLLDNDMLWCYNVRAVWRKCHSVDNKPPYREVFL